MNKHRSIPIATINSLELLCKSLKISSPSSCRVEQNKSVPIHSPLCRHCVDKGQFLLPHAVSLPACMQQEELVMRNNSALSFIS